MFFGKIRPFGNGIIPLFTVSRGCVRNASFLCAPSPSRPRPSTTFSRKCEILKTMRSFTPPMSRFWTRRKWMPRLCSWRISLGIWAPASTEHLLPRLTSRWTLRRECFRSLWFGPLGHLEGLRAEFLQRLQGCRLMLSERTITSEWLRAALFANI